MQSNHSTSAPFILGRKLALAALGAVLLAALWAANYLWVHGLWDDVLDYPGAVMSHIRHHAILILVARFLIGFAVGWILLSVSLIALPGLTRRMGKAAAPDENQDPRTL